MSLLKKLDTALDEAAQRLCPMGRALQHPQVDDNTRDKLLSILVTPVGTPGRVSNADLGRVLRSEGIPVTTTSIDRHRRGDCPCSTTEMSN